jgi:hypothetical protein
VGHRLREREIIARTRGLHETIPAAEAQNMEQGGVARLNGAGESLSIASEADAFNASERGDPR